MDDGVLSVTLAGTSVTPLWCAGSWAISVSCGCMGGHSSPCNIHVYMQIILAADKHFVKPGCPVGRMPVLATSWSRA